MNKKAESENIQDDLKTWYNLQVQLADLKHKEMNLRLKLFGTFFKEPHEGTNNVPLDKGWVLQATYPISRSVDVASLATLQPVFRDAKLPVKDLIRYKPELSVGEYRKLSDEQRKLFDQVLIIKPGTPQLELVLPKRPISST